MPRPGLLGKLGITFALIGLFRLGGLLPAAGVNYSNISACVRSVGSAATAPASILSVLSGGGLATLSLFSLGILPYITASISVSLLASAVPALAERKKQGAVGAAFITRLTRRATIPLAFIQGGGLWLTAREVSNGLLPGCPLPLLRDTSYPTAALFVMCIVVGAVLSMYLAELLTAHGVGHGASVLLVASVAASLPSSATRIAGSGILTASWVSAVIVALLLLVIGIELTVRRLPVIFATRAETGTQSATYLPLRLNQAGIAPVLFSSSVLGVVTRLRDYTGPGSAVTHWLGESAITAPTWQHLLLSAVAVAALGLFFLAVTVRPTEIATAVTGAGGFLPGANPGPGTVAAIGSTLRRLSILGVTYLSVLGAIPLLLQVNGVGAIPLGGTTLILLVSSALQLQAAFSRGRHPELRGATLTGPADLAAFAASGRAPRWVPPKPLVTGGGVVHRWCREVASMTWPRPRAVASAAGATGALVVVLTATVFAIDFTLGAALLSL